MSTAHVDRRSVAGPSVTRADVLDTALTLFAERGYHGTSLKHVAERLLIRTPSLYNHMDSKASLLRQIILSTLGEISAELEAADDPSTPPPTRLRLCVIAYAKRHAIKRRQALVVNQDTSHLDEEDLQAARERRREHERRFRQILEAGQASGEFEIDSARLASFAILEMCVGIARWFRDDGEFSPDQVAATYSQLALNLVRYSG